MSEQPLNPIESRPPLPFTYSRSQRILLLREAGGNRVLCMEDTRQCIT